MEHICSFLAKSKAIYQCQFQSTNEQVKCFLFVLSSLINNEINVRIKNRIQSKKYLLQNILLLSASTMAERLFLDIRES